MNRVLHYLTMAVLMVITFSILFHPEQAEESFTYFPADQKASFQSAATTLSLLQKKDAHICCIGKQTLSLIGKPIYARISAFSMQTAYLPGKSVRHGNSMLLK